MTQPTEHDNDSNSHSACLFSTEPCTECRFDIEHQLADEESAILALASQTASEVDLQELRKIEQTYGSNINTEEYYETDHSVCWLSDDPCSQCFVGVIEHQLANEESALPAMASQTASEADLDDNDNLNLDNNDNHSTCLLSEKPCSQCFVGIELQLDDEEAVKTVNHSPTASEADLQELREIQYEAYLEYERVRYLPKRYGPDFNESCNCAEEYGPLGDGCERGSLGYTHLNPRCPINKYFL